MQGNTVARQVTVVNPQGLHARPAHTLVNLANRFESDIQVLYSGEIADGKSILSILTLAAEQGAQLTIEATGVDAKEALDALEQLFRDGFGDAESGHSRQDTKANRKG